MCVAPFPNGPWFVSAAPIIYDLNPRDFRSYAP